MLLNYRKKTRCGFNDEQPNTKHLSIAGKKLLRNSFPSRGTSPADSFCHTDLRDFLETHFEIVSLDLAVAETEVQLRRAHHIRLPDAFIGATAQTREAVLVTRNTKDFHPDWEGIRQPYNL
jgi:PIN domain